MSYYRHHVFFCCNQRPEGETCCAGQGAIAAQTYAKDRIRALGLKGPGKVRINKAGCLDRCDDGPILVIYPEGVWYTYACDEDIEEIIQEHILNGRVVERLKR
ncbi:MAG: (2Fe-2S) ferredoxin domain-containing protein [Betaproteobacteria bacterium]|nr:(2Fe-2S) ferredoxin domain-containing protein [Betaproteobacteria bacterium]